MSEPHHYAYPLFEVMARPNPAEAHPGYLILSPLWDLDLRSADLAASHQFHWWHDVTPLGPEGQAILDGWSEAQNRVPLCGLPPGLWTPLREAATCPACQVSRTRLEAVLGRATGLVREFWEERRITIGLRDEVEQLRAKLGETRADAYPSIHERLLDEDG